MIVNGPQKHCKNINPDGLAKISLKHHENQLKFVKKNHIIEKHRQQWSNPNNFWGGSPSCNSKSDVGNSAQKGVFSVEFLHKESGPQKSNVS